MQVHKLVIILWGLAKLQFVWASFDDSIAYAHGKTVLLPSTKTNSIAINHKMESIYSAPLPVQWFSGTRIFIIQNLTCIYKYRDASESVFIINRMLRFVSWLGFSFSCACFPFHSSRAKAEFAPIGVFSFLHWTK